MKSILAKDGKVIGSWIMTKPETIERDSIEYKVYQGGITKQLDDQQFNISFIVDAKTGTILEIEKHKPFDRGCP